MNNELDISPRKQQLKEEYERLQQVYSELITKRDDLIGHEIPRLEALYMEAIGQLLYEELCLEYDIALLKYERDMLQSYVNRGEEPDIEVITLKVEQTAQTFNENIHREEEKIKQAKEYIEQHKEENTKQQEAEKLELKQIYKRLVHRLHPDLHPEQTEWERELFLKVQEAYRNEDLERLRQLEAELNAGVPFSSMGSDSIEDWEERVQKLKEQIAAIEEEIYKIEHDFPFTYRYKLNDKEWIVAQQEEINVRIERLQHEKERLQKIVEILRQQAHG
jgi:hypothetical protein